MEMRSLCPGDPEAQVEVVASGLPCQLEGYQEKRCKSR